MVIRGTYYLWCHIIIITITQYCTVCDHREESRLLQYNNTSGWLILAWDFLSRGGFSIWIPLHYLVLLCLLLAKSYLPVSGAEAACGSYNIGEPWLSTTQKGYGRWLLSTWYNRVDIAYLTDSFRYIRMENPGFRIRKDERKSLFSKDSDPPLYVQTLTCGSQRNATATPH